MQLLVIHGSPSGEVLRKVQRIVGATRIFQQGTDKDLYARYLRKQDCEYAMWQVNRIDGVWAESRPEK